MDDNSFEKMFNSIETKFEQKHDNESYLELMKLLIQKRTEYDIVKLKAQSQYNNDFMNNCFKFYMQDAYLKQQGNSSNDGYKDVEYSIDNSVSKIEQGIVSEAEWKIIEPDNEQEKDSMETGDEDENSDVEEEEDDEDSE